MPSNYITRSLSNLAQWGNIEIVIPNSAHYWLYIAIIMVPVRQPVALRDVSSISECSSRRR